MKYLVSFLKDKLNGICDFDVRKPEICDFDVRKPEICYFDVRKSEIWDFDFHKSEMCDFGVPKAEICDFDVRKPEICSFDVHKSEICDFDVRKPEICDFDVRKSEICDFDVHKSKICDFDVHKSVHHHTIQIIQPTRCNSFTSLLLDVYAWLDTFQASPRPSSGAYNCASSLWFNRWRAVAGALLVMVWQTTTNNAPAAVLQRLNQRLLAQLYAPDDGRGDA